MLVIVNCVLLLSFQLTCVHEPLCNSITDSPVGDAIEACASFSVLKFDKFDDERGNDIYPLPPTR